ncbi:MAG: site-specific DNA-methyltransferase [Verrucomicrobia bacterium]|nr:MAG: site-specific DNA-methyltransferase [Verrucomicrobiota bacterium]
MQPADIVVEKLSLESLDPNTDRLTRLRELYPDAFVEGKLDADKLRQIFGEDVDLGPERYGLSWAGKSDAIKAIQSLSTGTLLPCREESINFDATKNIIIEGDNLEVLRLLQRSYYGKVKMIYIDPPYNTGSDFIYPDNYKEGLQEYLRFSGQISREGYKLTTNPETSGRYHSRWLTMMYPRLFLARNLLSQNGVLFVSIGDHEIHNLRAMLDEIFGPENYINTVCVKAKPSAGASGGGEDKRLKKNLEFLLVYVRDRFAETALNLEAAFDEVDIMTHIESMREDEKSWKYTRALTDSGTRQFLDVTVDGEGNEIKIYEHSNYEFKPLAELALKGKGEEQVYRNYFDSIFRDTNAQSSIRTRVIEAIGNRDGLFSIEYVPRSGRNKGRLTTVFYKGVKKDQLAWLKDVARKENGKVIFREKIGTLWDDFNWNNVSKEGDMPFPNGKKPIAFIERMLSLATESDKAHIVIDFFAGSGSTAHSVLDLNAKDKGNRKFIMVQLPEPIDLEGCRTIADVCKERVRRVVKKLNESDTQELPAEGWPKPDHGFQVFKLSSSNFKIWDPETAPKDEKKLAEQLKLMVHNVVEGRGDEDLLYEIILKSGLPLTSQIDKITVAGLPAFNIENGTLIVCLVRPITQEALREVIALNPQRVLCLDVAFAGNDQLKTNIVLEMKSHGVEFRTV